MSPKAQPPPFLREVFYECSLKKISFPNLFLINRPRDLPIPNRDAAGIHYAMEFLQTWQQKQRGDDIDYERISAKGLLCSFHQSF